MQTAQFTVWGKPQAKQRPRFANTRTGVRTYTPKETAMYENLVALSYTQECRGIKLDGAIMAHIVAYFPIPKSASKKKKVLMEEKKIRFTNKPDTDNIAKSILDSLNGVAFDDDKQIVSLTVKKYYSEQPRVEVVLKEVLEDEL